MTAGACLRSAKIWLVRAHLKPRRLIPPRKPNGSIDSSQPRTRTCSSPDLLSFAFRVVFLVSKRRQWRRHPRGWPPATDMAGGGRLRHHRCSASYVRARNQAGGRSADLCSIVNACDPQNFEPNLALNLEISDLINTKKGSAYALVP